LNDLKAAKSDGLIKHMGDAVGYVLEARSYPCWDGAERAGGYGFLLAVPSHGCEYIGPGTARID
jgi:hypothetical protein